MDNTHIMWCVWLWLWLWLGLGLWLRCRHAAAGILLLEGCVTSSSAVDTFDDIVLSLSLLLSFGSDVLLEVNVDIAATDHPIDII